MKEDVLHDLEKDVIGAHYLKVDQIECLKWTSIFTVELLVSDHKFP